MIFNICQIKEIESHIEENSLIAFDLDNTLITSQSYIGSILWENKLISNFQNEGLSYEEAHEQACILWNQIQNDVKLIPIEKQSPDLIKKWKETSDVIGLTARSLTIKDLTHKGLISNNISFTSFPKHTLEQLHKGVLYCSHRSKSDVLLRFIDEVLRKKPKKIIFADDKKENLEDVLNSKLKDHFDVKCFYYSNEIHSGSKK